jgi:hypothetical protein
MAPLYIPEDPIPAMARPTISMLEEFARPHSRDPISNRITKLRKIYYDALALVSGGLIITKYLRAKVRVQFACQRLK